MGMFTESSFMRRFVIGVTGASGIPLAVSLLRDMRCLGLETHLIISRAALRVISEEGKLTADDLSALADFTYEPDDVAAPMASGSWRHGGMVICPCSMSSLGHIANGNGINLIHRAADVCLKEKRILVLVPRETPLSLIHIRNMLAAAEAGAVIFPPNPSFYHNPQSLDDLLVQMSGRILDCLGQNSAISRWGEPEKSARA